METKISLAVALTPPALHYLAVSYKVEPCSCERSLCDLDPHVSYSFPMFHLRLSASAFPENLLSPTSTLLVPLFPEGDIFILQGIYFPLTATAGEPASKRA